MRATIDMFEEDENRQAYEALLARNRNGAKDMFHYQTPDEQLKQKLYKGALEKMLDEVEGLPARIETVLDLLSQMPKEEVNDVLYRLGMDADKMISKSFAERSVKSQDKEHE